jgi:hypothetical protein
MGGRQLMKPMHWGWGASVIGLLKIRRRTMQNGPTRGGCKRAAQQGEAVGSISVEASGLSSRFGRGDWFL